MEIGKIIAIGLVGTIFAVLLKKENPQLAMLLAAVTGILIFGIICVPLGRLIGLLRETAETAGVGGRLFCSGAEGDRHSVSDAVRRTALRGCGRGNGCGKN